MPIETDRPAVYPLVERRIEKIELYLKAMTTTRMCEIIIEDYRNRLMSRLESLLEPRSDEQIRQLLKLIEPPELVLVRAGVIPMPRSSRQPASSNDGTDDPVPRLPVLDIAKQGLLFGVISCGLCIVSTYFALVCVQGAVKTDSDSTKLILVVIGSSIFVASVSVPIIGIVTSFKALIRLRRENGRFAGYQQAAGGVVLGAIALLMSMAAGILVRAVLFRLSSHL